MTELDLKLGLAKLLPEHVYFGGEMDQEQTLRWMFSFSEVVRDTEMLHICWLIEEKMTRVEANQYHNELGKTGIVWLWNAPWQLRAEAILEVIK